MQISVLTRGWPFAHNCIAEEFHEDYVTNFAATRSIAKSVAVSLSISHLFCAFSIAERRERNLMKPSNPDDFAIREQHWLEVLAESALSNAIFICGPDHVQSFQRLLEANAYETTILEGYYKGDLFPKTS
jgi:hypothetical protein